MKVGLNPMVLVTSGLAIVVLPLAGFSNDGAEFHWQVMSCDGERQQSLIIRRKTVLTVSRLSRPKSKPSPGVGCTEPGVSDHTVV